MDRKAWKHTILQPNSYSFAVSETGIGYNAWAGDCSQNDAWEAIMWYNSNCNTIVLQLGLGLGTENGYFFFFPYLKLTNTFVLLFWADDTLNYALIYNPGI